MKKTNIIQFVMCSILPVFAGMMPAHAVSITNLDTLTHHLVVKVVGGEEIHKPILPRQTIRLSPQRQTLTLMLKSGNRSIEAQELNQYVIWPGGEMKLQRRIRTGTRGGGLQ